MMVAMAASRTAVATMSCKNEVRRSRARGGSPGWLPHQSTGRPAAPGCRRWRAEHERGGGGERHEHADHHHAAKQRLCADEAGNGQEQPGHKMPARAPVRFADRTRTSTSAAHQAVTPIPSGICGV